MWDQEGEVTHNIHIKKKKKMATFHNAHAVVVVVVQDYRAVGRSENLERGQTVMWGSQICPPPPTFVRFG